LIRFWTSSSIADQTSCRTSYRTYNCEHLGLSIHELIDPLLDFFLDSGPIRWFAQGLAIKRDAVRGVHPGHLPYKTHESYALWGQQGHPEPVPVHLLARRINFLARWRCTN
jgi:hypothetical protein